MTEDKSVDRYSYSIDIKPLPAARPDGGTHVARLASLLDRQRKVEIAVDLFGEAYGTNDAEAHTKMKQKVEAWIAVQDEFAYPNGDYTLLGH